MIRYLRKTKNRLAIPLKNTGLSLLMIAILLTTFSPTLEVLLKRVVYADYNPGWGVLSVNTNKSIYEVGDTARFEYAVLDDFGGMVCSAEVEMRLTNEKQGIDEIFSTENGKIRVNEACKKKAYVEVPDFESSYFLGKAGTYEIELTAEITAGRYTIRDSFEVTDSIEDFSVERIAPTRIYPPENYPVTLKVAVNKDFRGKVVDKVPLNFEITNGLGFSVKEETGLDYKKIIWEVDWVKGQQYELNYEFKAPDKSPEYYELGELSFVKEYSFLNIFNLFEYKVFEESRTWQIASDAANDIILFWGGDLGSIPSGWAAVSESGGTYDSVFLRGAATAGGTGGADNHDHTVTLSSISSSDDVGYRKGNLSTIEGAAAHSHSAYTADAEPGTGTNLPEYSTLIVIQSSGTPTTIPQNVIALFDADPGSGWTRYSAQDGKYMYGSDTVGTAGGNTSNVHTHNVTSITLTTNSGTLNVKAGNDGLNLVSHNTHTHDSDDVTSTSATTEPLYTEVLLYYPDSADVDLPSGLIALFDTTPLPSDWDSLSGSGGDFENSFIKPAGTYGGTGGSSAVHTHAGVAGGTSLGGAGSYDSEAAGTGLVLLTHTHTFDVALVELESQTYIPPYVDVVVAKYNPVTIIYTQNDFEWFAPETTVTLTNAWPIGAGTDIVENGQITQLPFANEALTTTDQIRLQMNFTVTGSLLSAATEDFQLEYDTAIDCTTASGWADVGAKASGSIWRFYAQGTITDGDTQVNDISTSSSSAEGDYVESNPTQTNPNQIEVGESSEWDFAIENNGAADNTTYCFRMVIEDGSSGTAFDTYNADSYPKLTTAPATVNQMRHGNIFSDEGEQGFYWAD